MNLFNLINDNYKIVSIVGLAKNTGKTTTLNHLIYESIREGITIGITSVGRDGEEIDLVTETKKPEIYVDKGVLIATAQELLTLGSAKVSIIKKTNYRTALGNVVIGRVKVPGTIQIGGPQSLREIKEVADTLLDLGAKFVLLDGAIDRKSSAAPIISEATILSTGAAISKDINMIIEETNHIIDIFRIPQLENKEIHEIISKLIEQKKIVVIDDKLNIDEIKIETALESGKIIGAHLNDNSRYLVIPGSLVSKTIDEIINTRKYLNIEIVIRDSTKIFLNSKDLKKYNYLGVKIRVLQKINLIALTINPTSPKGFSLDPEDFLVKMKENIEAIPVYDVNRKVVR